MVENDRFEFNRKIESTVRKCGPKRLKRIFEDSVGEHFLVLARYSGEDDRGAGHGITREADWGKDYGDDCQEVRKIMHGVRRMFDATN